MNKRLIRLYYNQGFYTDKDLDVFVYAVFLTEAEKEEMKGHKTNGK